MKLFLPLFGSTHDRLTLTEMYNVLEKLRGGDALTPKEQEIHEKGLVSVLKQIHDELDDAVLKAYGWPANLSDGEILERLVALNSERAAEERRGIIRWLRPEFQNPAGMEQTQAAFEEVAVASLPGAKTKKPAWPSGLAAQAQAVRSALLELATPAAPQTIARCFTRARVDRVTELLEALASLGQVRQLEDETFVIQ